MAKLTQKELAMLRADYLQKREKLLKKKVSSLSIKLFEKVFDNYLAALEQADGMIVHNERNLNMIAGLDAVYRNFVINDNMPVVTGFVDDIQKIIPLNERYFKNIAQYEIHATTENAKKVVDRRLGLLPDGTPKPNGFVDKFINDKQMLKDIKRQSMQAMTKGKSFQDFRVQLKNTIQGEEAGKGTVHQYYRNYAYDTYQKVDRLAGTVFAKELELRYFYWQGGLIKTSRAICEKCNGMIIDSYEFKNFTYERLKEKYREGIPDGTSDTWDPMNDLGGYGCHHSIDWIADSIAQRYSDKILKLSTLLD